MFSIYEPFYKSQGFLLWPVGSPAVGAGERVSCERLFLYITPGSRDRLCELRSTYHLALACFK